MRALVVGSNRQFEDRVLAYLKADPDMEIVGLATDGREGIRQAKEFLPDLVITQFDMEDMTGPALTRTLKSDGIPPPAVIIVSLTDSPLFDQLAHQAGADGCLAMTTFGQFDHLIRRLKQQH